MCVFKLYINKSEVNLIDISVLRIQIIIIIIRVQLWTDVVAELVVQISLHLLETWG